MDAIYLVPPVPQKSRMTCVATTVYMLDRWYLDRIGAAAGTPLFSEIVDVSAKQVADSERQLNQVGLTLAKGVSEAKISDFVRKIGYESIEIEVSPESFLIQLQKSGPFVYIERIRREDLPTKELLESLSSGSQFDHAVLVTGLTQRRGNSTIYYNDPAAAARTWSMNFFEFIMTAHRPLRGLDKTLIIFHPDRR